MLQAALDAFTAVGIVFGFIAVWFTGMNLVLSAGRWAWRKIAG